tara:strand:- start:58 stop:732 length:675 start_codon:yes stop_codon:yes gene_type:complete
MNKIKLRINRLFNYIFGEKFKKKLDYKWENYPSRVKIIQEIIEFKKYNNYLEIGCDNDDLFSKIKINFKIGVDPISGGTLRITSDDFFKENKDTFDIIFIDGLHHYKQVKKDIINSLNCINENGVIILHDCMPISYLEQAVPRSQHLWTGDVWKAFVEIRTKEDCDSYTCLADKGLGIVMKRTNKNQLSIKMDNFQKLKFKDYYYNHQTMMNIIEYIDIQKIFK